MSDPLRSAAGGIANHRRGEGEQYSRMVYQAITRSDYISFRSDTMAGKPIFYIRLLQLRKFLLIEKYLPITITPRIQCFDTISDES